MSSSHKPDALTVDEPTTARCNNSNANIKLLSNSQTI